jgi:hypothetical protein
MMASMDESLLTRHRDRALKPTPVVRSASEGKRRVTTLLNQQLPIFFDGIASIAKLNAYIKRRGQITREWSASV